MKDYEIIIDGIKYTIPVTSINEFMSLDNETYNRIMTNKEPFNGIPLPEFLYSIGK